MNSTGVGLLRTEAQGVRRSGTTVINGGARSGKSRLALQLAMSSGRLRCFIATAEAFDDEMRARIERHRDERGDLFVTLEAGLNLPQLLRETCEFDVVVVDCVTLYLSRVLLGAETESGSTQQRQCEAAIDELLRSAGQHPARLIFVTNEVGMGIVPPTPLGRVFRDVAGRANQRLAEHADELYLATMGVALRLRPTPVTTLAIESHPLEPIGLDPRALSAPSPNEPQP